MFDIGISGRTSGGRIPLFVVSRFSIFGFIILVQTLLSCVSAPREFAAQVELVRSYSEEGEKKEPFEAPYYSSFSSKDKTVVVAAIRHSSLLASDSHRTVQKIFEDFKPDYVVVEGYESAVPLDEKLYRRDLPECRDLPGFNCDPSPYSFITAYENKISSSGGEPSEADIQRRIVKAGFTTEDLINFYVVRQVAQWKRESALNDGDLSEKMKNFADHYSEQMKSQYLFRYNDFLIWYRKHLGRDFSKSDVDVTPLAHGGTFLNKISNQVSLARNAHLLQVVADGLNTHDRVLVVYGAGHLVSIRPAMTQMLGPSRDFKPF